MSHDNYVIIVAHLATITSPRIGTHLDIHVYIYLYNIYIICDPSDQNLSQHALMR